MTTPVRLLVEVVPDPDWDETPETLRTIVHDALNRCHVHGTTNTATVRLLTEGEQP